MTRDSRRNLVGLGDDLRNDGQRHPVVRVRDRLREVGEWQAALCERLGSPTWAAVIRRLLPELARGGAASSLLDDGADPSTSMVWLRLLGAVHRLVLDDPRRELAAYLPTAGGRLAPDRAAAAAHRFLEAETETVRVEMRQRVQTNEVGRAAALSAAMNWLGGELDLFELGASAGLNLWLDRYRVTTETTAWGPPDAKVVLEGAFSEGCPPAEDFRVRTRRGCDLDPLDPSDPAHRRLLRSFVWPDHVERLARLDAAIAAAGRTTIDRSDCVTWTRRQMRRRSPARGRSVVYHSVVLPYLRHEEEQELAEVIEEAGRHTDEARRLAWLTLEPFADTANELELAVRRWPENDAWRLATVAPLGGEIRWHPRRLERPRAPTAKAGKSR